MNCALFHKSKRFGTVIDHDLTIKFRDGAKKNSPPIGRGGHFKNGGLKFQTALKHYYVVFLTIFCVIVKGFRLAKLIVSFLVTNWNMSRSKGHTVKMKVIILFYNYMELKAHYWYQNIGFRGRQVHWYNFQHHKTSFSRSKGHL